jgi:hypothetical protein
MSSRKTARRVVSSNARRFIDGRTSGTNAGPQADRPDLGRADPSGMQGADDGHGAVAR